MSRISELIAEGKRHHVSLKNQKGRTLINISLLLALILIVVVPQILLAVLIGILLEIIDVEFDDQALGWDGKG
ncbi:MAG: DUF4342 domain-containing protein [Candidatus Promineifilaceae bacterium]|jgi:hypothetical protein